MNPKCLSQVINILNIELFYYDKHKIIYKCINDLYSNNINIDIYTIIDKLKNNNNLNNIGGEYYLLKLMDKISSSIHIIYHSKQLKEKYILRKLINEANNIIDNCYNDKYNILDVLDIAESKIFDLHKNYIKTFPISFSDLLDKTINLLKSKNLYSDIINGIPSGFTKLDNITSGWQNSDLIIIAGRPAMGKSSFILSMISNIVTTIPTLLFTLEMSNIQVMLRLLSYFTDISYNKLRNASLLKNKDLKLLDKNIKKLKKLKLFIEDTASISLNDIRNICRQMVINNDIKLIIIDYMQLILLNKSKTNLPNREQEISYISRTLKSIAKELNIPVIVLSQLSRAVETRGGYKRPILSDLRDSGSIEQDADIVIFLYRPEYYGYKY